MALHPEILTPSNLKSTLPVGLLPTTFAVKVTGCDKKAGDELVLIVVTEFDNGANAAATVTAAAGMLKAHGFCEVQFAKPLQPVN